MTNLLSIALLLTTVLAGADANPTRYEFTGIEMAVPIRIVLYAENEGVAKAAADAALARFRELNGVMSDYDPTSEVRQLSATSGSGEAVHVGNDLWRVLVRAKQLSRDTDGAFDVTIGPVVRLWRRARRQEQLPSPERIAQARKAVGYEAIELDESKHTVRLTRPEMWIDLGGIAKGYALDEALKTIAEHGIRVALIDAGGDIVLGDAPPNRPGWVIGVAALELNARPSVFLSISNTAIATSGDSWQFVEIDGKRYSHLVDPRTGIGLTDHSSVTVIASDAMTADVLASAVSVLGPKAGLKVIDAAEGTAAFVVRSPNGQVETYSSARWDAYPKVDPAKLRR